MAYPFAFKKDYSFDLSEEDLEQLQIENEEDVLTYAVVTMKETLQDSTINLLAPLVINVEKNMVNKLYFKTTKPFHYASHCNHWKEVLSNACFIT